jgi:hypothetical protein
MALGFLCVFSVQRAEEEYSLLYCNIVYLWYVAVLYINIWRMAVNR